MRLVTLALLGLTFAASLASIASPAHATRQPASAPTAGALANKARAAAPVVKAPIGKSGAGMARVQHASYQHAFAPNGFQKGATPAGCDRRARHCRGSGLVKTHFGWTQGLPPAAGVQANECPDGTLATLARGHEDVVRCMPI